MKNDDLAKKLWAWVKFSNEEAIEPASEPLTIEEAIAQLRSLTKSLQEFDSSKKSCF